jgi:hexosaminidase
MDITSRVSGSRISHFPWRGLLIDAGRHYGADDVLKRNLDAHGGSEAERLSLAPDEDQGFPRRGAKSSQLT